MSMNATERTKDLLFIMDKLIGLLKDENAALERNEVRTVEAGQEVKGRLIRAYESRMKPFTENPYPLMDVAPELRERLRKDGALLDQLIADNMRRLASMIESGQHVMEAVIEAARAHQESHGTTYSKTGQAFGRYQGRGAPRPSLALNETL